MKTYGKLDHFQGSWIISCEPHVLILLRRMLPRMARNDNFVGVADTLETSRQLEWFVSRYPLEYASPAVEGRLSERARQHRDSEAFVAALLDPKDESAKPIDFRLAIPAREYQKEGGTLILNTAGILIADDLGTGKTATAICCLTDARTRPALVVTLTHLPAQWQSEILKFVPRLSTHVLQGTRPYPIDKRCGGKFPDVVITSYSKLDGWKDALAPLKTGLFRTVIFDEVQELRTGAETAKGAAAHRIARKATYRAGLSATPIYNLGGEIHSVIEVVRPGALGTKREFSQEWCVGDSEKPGKLRIKDPKAMGAYLLDSGLMIRRTRQDIGREIPQLTRVPHTIDCDMKELNKIESKALALAQIIMSKSQQSRGQQMQASAELNNLVRQATGVAKAAFVAEFVRMLTENDERVIVYAWHREVYAILMELLSSDKNGSVNLQPAMYTGSESQKQKQEAKEKFCDGEARVLLLSLRSGAGLDGLQHHCRIGVFAELDWSSGVHEQCLSADTEILTRDGFKGVNDVDVGSTVAGFDMESGAIRWVPALTKTDRRLGTSEQMFAVRTNKIDIRVTGEHRMVVRRKRRFATGSIGRSPWAIELAQDLVGQSRRTVPLNGRQEAAGVPLTDYELRFLGWFASDGSFNGKMVTIYQSAHQPWNDDIVEVLNGCGMNWKLYSRPIPEENGGGVMNMYQVAKGARHFWSKEDVDTMTEMQAAGESYVAIAGKLGMSQAAVGKKARKIASRIGRAPEAKSQGRIGWQSLAAYLDKDLSPLLGEMTRDQLKRFLHGVFMGDGAKSKTRRTTMRITSTNHVFLSRLQSLCVRRGMSAHISTRKSRTKANRLAYDIWISDAAEAGLPTAQKVNCFKACESSPGERVWCVSNELGTLVTRRNGKVSIVGNCEGRIARDGQPAPTLFYYLLAAFGSDPIISDLLGIKRAQLEGVRDPKGAFEHGLDSEGQNVRRLAQAYLLKHAGKIRA